MRRCALPIDDDYDKLTRDVKYYLRGTVTMNKQFQGSKKKARKKAYLDRKAQREAQRKRFLRIYDSDCGIEERAMLLGVRLK